MLNEALRLLIFLLTFPKRKSGEKIFVISFIGYLDCCIGFPEKDAL
jgi:hypothetical protein